MSSKNQVTDRASDIAERWLETAGWALGSASSGVLRAGSASMDWGAELIDRLQGLDVPDRASKLATTSRKRWQELDVPERANKLAKTGREVSDNVTQSSPTIRMAVTVLAIIGAFTVLRIVLKLLGWFFRKLRGSSGAGKAASSSYGPHGDAGVTAEAVEGIGGAGVPPEEGAYAESAARSQNA